MNETRTKALACLALLIVLGVALAAGRDPVSGSGSADALLFPDGTGTASGEATLVIGGTTLNADVVVQIYESYFRDEGVLHGVSSHTFDFGGGDEITTSDKVVGEFTGPPGLLTLNEKLTIVSGTGAYDGVSGDMTVHGQLQFTGPATAVVTYDIVGAISR
ncbi:MAG: hypothetical protein JSU70_08635 [Phycisphaerales bacterium]|nr:MAG: hypothetical protein JSU70_08635 [Phycisphaerales bacterium]